MPLLCSAPHRLGNLPARACGSTCLFCCFNGCRSMRQDRSPNELKTWNNSFGAIFKLGLLRAMRIAAWRVQSTTAKGRKGGYPVLNTSRCSFDRRLKRSSCTIWSHMPRRRNAGSDRMILKDASGHVTGWLDDWNHQLAHLMTGWEAETTAQKHRNPFAHGVWPGTKSEKILLI